MIKVINSSKKDHWNQRFRDLWSIRKKFDTIDNNLPPWVELEEDLEGVKSPEGEESWKNQRQICRQIRELHFQKGESEVRDIQRPRQSHVYIWVVQLC